VVRATVGLALVLLLGSPSAEAQTDRPCWRALITDWSDGRIDGTYPTTCYRQAIAKAPEDLKIYSSLETDLGQALRTPTRSLAVSTAVRDSSDSSTLPYALFSAGAASLLILATATLLAVCRQRSLSGSRSRARSGADASAPPD
jgi:hypothetical protein